MNVKLHENGDYWQARWVNRLGQRKGRSLGPISELSRRKAEKICEAIAAEENVTPTLGGKAPTLQSWAEKYMLLRKNDLADGTKYLHSLTIKYLIKRFGNEVRIDRIDRVAAAEWRAGLGLGEQSACLHTRNAKVIFETAKELHLIKDNPFCKLKGTPPKVDKTWAEITDANLELILTECADSEWRCAFALARWAGLRIGECSRVEWSDIDWETRVLNVVHTGETSTKKWSRTVPIRPKLYELLRHVFEAAEDGSFGPVGPAWAANNRQRDAVATVQRAGFPAYAKPFHTLRKNCESEWMDQYPVLTVCAWLGNSPAVAAKHYTRPSESSIASVIGVGKSLNSASTATNTPQTTTS